MNNIYILNIIYIYLNKIYAFTITYTYTVSVIEIR